MSSCMGLKLSYPKQAFNACLMSVASVVMPLSFSRLQSYAIFPVPGTHRPGTGLPARWHRFAPKRVHLCQPPGTGVPRKRTTRPSALPLPTRTTRPEAPRPSHRTKPLAKKAILRQAAGCPAGRWWNNRLHFVKYCYRGGVILDFLRSLRPIEEKKGFQMLFSSQKCQIFVMPKQRFRIYLHNNRP